MTTVSKLPLEGALPSVQFTMFPEKSLRVADSFLVFPPARGEVLLLANPDLLTGSRKGPLFFLFAKILTECFLNCG